MGDASPTLTIGVPVYNGERYLEQTLEGIRAQSFTDFRVVIADNASTDRTGEIAQAAVAADPRFHYVRRERNLGLVPNYNQLFADTSGEFFAWHDGDDLTRPEFYEACLELLRRHPEAAAATTEILLIDSDGDPIGPDPEHIRADHPDRAIRFTEVASFDHFCQFTYGVYRREMMARTRLMLPHFWSSDRLFLAELALQGPLVRDPRQFYLVRQHDERVTLGGRAKFYAGLAAPRRGTTLRYSRELGAAVEHANLEPAEQRRVMSALRGWRLRNGHRIARSAVGAMVGAGVRATSRGG
jgi:glycosyltransferase involved in cell wall biosynthesis